MDKNSVRRHDGNINHNAGGNSRERTGGGEGPLLLRASSDEIRHTTTPTSKFLLQWGNRKRLRCTRIQAKDESTGPAQRTASLVFRPDKDEAASNNNTTNHTDTNHSNGYLHLRQLPSSPQQPRRLLRNSETSSAMRGISNGGVRGIATPDKVGAHDKRGSNGNNHSHLQNNEHSKPAASSDTAHDSKKGGTPSGSGDAIPQVWPPRLVIALTNKEKEEDFLAIKGSKLPQRPKKRAKFIQRSLNLVSPGAWLCDLTLERYEVREKKISKKKPRGLRAMGNMESESE